MSDIKKLMAFTFAVLILLASISPTYAVSDVSIQYLGTVEKMGYYYHTFTIDWTCNCTVKAVGTRVNGSTMGEVYTVHPATSDPWQVDNWVKVDFYVQQEGSSDWEFLESHDLDGSGGTDPGDGGGGTDPGDGTGGGRRWRHRSR